ncbi:hypothetical protein B0J12DRAFT_737021 [Macrophomina phaseolina]|nr:hypothetical protein B0J12DRAFT_737021 [Macrophomina phaseolina]
MSFLNSVLSSIGGGAGQSQSQSGRAAPSQAPAAKPTQTPRVGGSSNGVASATAPKRKAEGDPASIATKAARKEPESTRSNPVSRTGTASPVVKPTTTPNTIPYRGTAQPSGTVNPARKPTFVASSAKPSASTAAAKPVSKPAPVAAASSSGPAPKKGSYQEILARAKAAQQAKAPVGAIKHKPVEKLSKKDRLALEEKNKQAAAAAKDPKLAHKLGLKGQAKAVDPKVVETAKEKKKAPDLGYQGTMRPAPKEPAYQGTMNRGLSARKPGLDRGDRSRSGSLGPKPAEKRYRYYDEDEDEDEEDYDSEGSSDMEAGIFDVDKEEEMALRIARKEDEEALREEEELKRKKAERKKMLERMNSQAKKKKAY